MGICQAKNLAFTRPVEGPATHPQVPYGMVNSLKEIYCGAGVLDELPFALDVASF
jgi:hypothetical protein